MKTQIELARAGIITEAMKKVAMDEGFGLDPETIRRRVSDGHIIIAVSAACTLPVGNVPLYQAFSEASCKYHNPSKLDAEYLFELIERQLVLNQLQCLTELARMDKNCFRSSSSSKKVWWILPCLWCGNGTEKI